MPRLAEGPLPEGVRLISDFLSLDEERALSTSCAALVLTAPVMHGVAARRRTAHFGWLYGYESGKAEPGPPVPAFLLPLCGRVAPLLARAPEEVLVTEYTPGATIGWHRDAPMFGPTVVGVSLLAPCRMRFQRGKDAARPTSALRLAPRSACVLAGEARAIWQHSIPAIQSLRSSITFRTIQSPLESSC